MKPHRTKSIQRSVIALLATTLLLGHISPTAAHEPGTATENPYIHVIVNSLSANGKKVALSLTLKNKTDGDLLIMYAKYPIITGDDGSHSRLVDIEGLGFARNRNSPNKMSNYTRLFSGGEAVINLHFHLSKKSTARRYSYTSVMAIYNASSPKEPLVFNAGIAGIAL